MKTRSVGLVVLAVSGLLPISVTQARASNAPPMVQQAIRYNFEYKCGGETVVISHCRIDDDRPGMPATRPEGNYCQVYYPDRPKRNGFTAMAAELRSDVVKKLQACGALAASQPTSQPTPPPTSATAGSGAKPPSGGMQGGKSDQPTAQSGVDGLVQAVSDLFNNLNSQLQTAQPGPKADVQAATNESKKGQAYLKAKDYIRAIEHFNNSIAIGPSSAAYAGLGSAYYGLKQYPQAIEAYKQVIRMVPNNAEVHLWLAMAYQRHGSDLVSGPSATKDLKPFENAEAAAREAIRLKADYQPAYFYLGSALYVQSKYSEGLTAFQQAIRLQPGDKESLYVLALTNVKLSKKEEAMQVYGKLAALDKEYAQDLLTAINKASAAVPQPAASASPEANAYLAHGNKYSEAKDYPKAIEAYKKAISLRPAAETLARCYYGLANSYDKLGQYQDYVLALKESLRLKPNEPGAHFGLGWGYYNLKQYPDALAAFKEADRLKPNDADNHYWIGEVYLVGFNQAKNALTPLRESLRLRPNDPRTNGELGIVYFNLKQYPNAAAALKEAIRLKPGDPHYYSSLGLTYHIMGKRDELHQLYGTLEKLDKKKARELDVEIAAYVAAQLLNSPPTSKGGSPTAQPTAATGTKPQSTQTTNQQARVQSNPAPSPNAQVSVSPGAGQIRSAGQSQGVLQLRASAEKGNPESQYQLANRLLKGLGGVPRDEAEAIVWYRKAAEQGHAAAQHALAGTYETGRLVAKDDAQAMGWFRKAAEQGHESSLLALALAYEYGRGVAKDDVQAAEWYRKLAERGSALAQYDLGMRYVNGKGVAVNLVEAFKWTSLAVARSPITTIQMLNSNAEQYRRSLSELESRMTAEQIEAGKKLGREWTEKFEQSQRR